MKDAGVTTSPYQHQAHHIVPEGETRYPSAVEAKDILEKYDIDLNSACNGIFLPYVPGSQHAGSAAFTEVVILKHIISMFVMN